MRMISSDIMKELKADAKEYMTSVKGKTLTREDIIIAETLIMFGYMKAKLKSRKKNDKMSLTKIQ